MKPARLPANALAAALAAGLPAPLVFFVAASAFEKSPAGEIAGGLLFGALYLAFAQFWVAPRRPESARDLWATVLGALGPLACGLLLVTTLENPRALWQLGLPVLATGVAAGWAGAWLARRLTAPAPVPPRTAASRRALHATGGGLLLAATVILFSAAVPAVLANRAPGFNTGANVTFLRVTGLFDLGGAVILAVAAWQAAQPALRGTAGFVAFAALLLGLMHLGMGVLCVHYGLDRAAVFLGACVTANLGTSLLVTLDSVLDDRRLPAANTVTAGSVAPAT